MLVRLLNNSSPNGYSIYSLYLLRSNSWKPEGTVCKYLLSDARMQQSGIGCQISLVFAWLVTRTRHVTLGTMWRG